MNLGSYSSMVDKDTPNDVKGRSGMTDGADYVLVFSDEFEGVSAYLAGAVCLTQTPEDEGRSFYEGDDPYWEAVDLYYSSTGDLERYRPDSVTTKNGYLDITWVESIQPCI